MLGFYDRKEFVKSLQTELQNCFMCCLIFIVVYYCVVGFEKKKYFKQSQNYPLCSAEPDLFLVNIFTWDSTVSIQESERGTQVSLPFGMIIFGRERRDQWLITSFIYEFYMSILAMAFKCKLPQERKWILSLHLQEAVFQCMLPQLRLHY